MLENYAKYVRIEDTFLLKNGIESFEYVCELDGSNTLSIIMRSGETHLFNRVGRDIFKAFKVAIKLGDDLELS